MTKPYYTQLTNRTVISVSGPDTDEFLQGLITNDIHKASTEALLYSCFLTPQGKFLFDFFILKTDEGHLLDVESGRHQEFLMRLTMFKLRSDVTLKDLSQEYKIYAAWGEGALGGYPDPRLPELGVRFIRPVNKVFEMDGEAVDFDAYDHHRLTLGVPDGSRDMIPERSGMLESNMDRLHALDWDKGCYMGQELTARTHYRGLVKRRLMPFTYEGEAPEFGAIIRSGDEKIGDIRSTCNAVGLALVKVEQAESAVSEKQPLLLSSGKSVELLA